MKIPSTTTSTHAFELQIERRNKHGRPLSTITAMKSNDRAEVEAEHARRTETYSQSPALAKRNTLKIIENKNVREQS